MAPCCTAHLLSPCHSPALPVCNTRLRQLARPSLTARLLPSNGANGVRWSAGTVAWPQASGAVAAATGGAPVVTDSPNNFLDVTSDERLYSWWECEGYFRLNLEKDAISMLPPKVAGALHMAWLALFVTLEDNMRRHWRTRGRSSRLAPGTDHAGIATQLVGEKLLASEGVKRTAIGREEFIKRNWEWKHKYGGTISNQMRWLGPSCVWERLDDQLSSLAIPTGLVSWRCAVFVTFSEAVVEAFVQLHEEGPNSRGSYRVNWSPNLQTAVSDLAAGEPSTPCDSCNGRGWLVCDFCEGLKVNVQGKNGRIYRRCPSCRTAGVVICPRCKVFKCVSFPDDKDSGIALQLQ